MNNRTTSTLQILRLALRAARYALKDGAARFMGRPSQCYQKRLLVSAQLDQALGR